MGAALLLGNRTRPDAISASFVGSVVQIAGSVIENPHGRHWNTFVFSPNARQIVRR
jgi:hypothetical protein